MVVIFFFFSDNVYLANKVWSKDIGYKKVNSERKEKIMFSEESDGKDVAECLKKEEKEHVKV